MTTVTQLQRDNLAIARAMWLKIPKDKVSIDLGTWRYDTLSATFVDPPTCNTVACFGGWCAWVPEFMAQGVKASSSGSPYLEQFGLDSSADVSEALFGDRNIFCFRGDYETDILSSPSDWQIVLDRIDYLRYSSRVR